MTLRINPRYPLVWRSPDTLQLGVDSPVLFDDPPPLQLRLLADLGRGTTMARLSLITRSAGADPEVVTSLIDRIRDRLDVEAAPGPWWVDGDSALAARIRARLIDLGQVLDPDDPRAVVVVRDWTLDPAAAQHWLAADIAQLPVVAADASVSVGPLITPGAGPCLYCLHAHRVDGDEAWPALAYQLLERPSSPDPLAVEFAIAGAVRLLLTEEGALQTSRQWRFTADGRPPTSELIDRHPSCLCRDSLATVPLSA
jgi:hypothetical protein